VIVLVWLPVMLWELFAGMGLGSIAAGVPVYEQYMSLLTYVLAFEPYHFQADTGDALSWKAIAGWFCLGQIWFTFMEHTLHKYLFHREPQSRVANALHFVIHGAHHVTPLDRNRLVFPPVPLSILRAIFYVPAVYLVTPDKASFHCCDAGVLFAYLCYDLMHYANHHANIKCLRSIKRHHLRHHYHAPGEAPCNFALSYLAMFWDFVFQTGCPPRSNAVGDAAKLDSTGSKLE
jgi:4-hydroxysphinganine ceramide fatty acyl 2-hydroxylase